MMEYVAIRVSTEIRSHINALVGHHGCKNVDDVIRYLIKKAEENENDSM